MNEHTISSQRFDCLDVLKAVAILAVVLYHSGFLKYGYFGVDVFLVISGYLITRSILSSRRYEEDNGCNWYFSFTVSRLTRLLPVLLVAELFAMILGWFTMLPDDYENLSESVVATNFFANNILSANTTADYWNIANEYKPLMHTWYLGLLMQFYLFYPLLFLISKIDKQSPRNTLLVIISSLAVLSLFCYFGCTKDAHRFYYLPSRFFECAIGGIIALLYHPSQKKLLYPLFSYLCYALLLFFVFSNSEIIPSTVRLLFVVTLSAIVILSGDSLNNRFTSNKVLAKIGVASYSIFVWHQVFLAFYRYINGNHFSFWAILLLAVLLAFITWCSYHFIEQGVLCFAKNKSTKGVLIIAVSCVWLFLTAFAGCIYLKAGIVRDVPELYVSLQNRHRGMNAEYCDRGNQYDRPFVTEEKPHWLVIGNSFGRDFVNTILESDIANLVEISYTNDYSKPENLSRFESADRVFISTRGLSKNFVSAIEVKCWESNLSPDRIVIVGEKNFGENNGHVYAKRHRADYFDQYVDVAGGTLFLDRNSRFRNLYGDRFIDLMTLVTNDSGQVRVFTPDHHFFSADGKHLTRAGARYFAERIDWNKYLE